METHLCTRDARTEQDRGLFVSDLVTTSQSTLRVLPGNGWCRPTGRSGSPRHTVAPSTVHCEPDLRLRTGPRTDDDRHQNLNFSRKGP